MSLNSTELQLIIDQIPCNAIIQNFTQSHNRELYLQIVTQTETSYLYISLVDGKTGLFQLPREYEKQVPKGKKHFSQKAESMLRGARILTIKQPQRSRIIDIQLRYYDTELHLLARLWGNGANILITNKDYTIIDVAKRYPSRGEWPNETFQFPHISNPQEFKLREGINPEHANNQLYELYHTPTQKNQLTEQKETIINKFDTKLAELDSQILQLTTLINESQAERFKHYADLLNGVTQEPRAHDEFLFAYDYAEECEVKVPLVQGSSLRQMITYYYDKYKKEKNAFLINQKRLAKLRDERSEIRAQILQLEETTSVHALSRFQASPPKPAHGKPERTVPGRKVKLSEGFVAYISRNAKEADAMLKTTARGNDYWFHIRDNAGSHVIVKWQSKKQLPNAVRLEAAMLALHFSKSKLEKEGDIYFTQVKYLHKPNTGTPGLVFPTQEKNIKIKKDQMIIDNLLKNTC